VLVVVAVFVVVVGFVLMEEIAEDVEVEELLDVVVEDEFEE
jgi:hypothetical protein